jgi:CBS domain containing-hemolysin-like protein
MASDDLLNRALQKIDIDSDQKEMIRGVVEFGSTTVKEVMVPRIDTDALSGDAEAGETLKRITESDHSRFPVYGENIDDIIGILYVKDVLRALIKNGGGRDSALKIGELLRPAFFVPESKHIDDLLREFRKKHVHIAVVVDEYGGVSGIVCMEDILEEIIGDIKDEFDDEKEDVTEPESGVFLCDARVNLDDLSERTGLSFPTDDFDTLGGFVFNLLGKIPEQGECAEWENHTFEVTDVDGHKINTVRIGKS